MGTRRPEPTLRNVEAMLLADGVWPPVPSPPPVMSTATVFLQWVSVLTRRAASVLTSSSRCASGASSTPAESLPAGTRAPAAPKGCARIVRTAAFALASSGRTTGAVDVSRLRLLPSTTPR